MVFSWTACMCLHVARDYKFVVEKNNPRVNTVCICSKFTTVHVCWCIEHMRRKP